MRDENQARVEVVFTQTPSLAMLVESAAQASSAIDSSEDISTAYLVALKEVSLLHSPKNNNFEILIQEKQNLANMKILAFDVYELSEKIANGTLTIAIELKER